MTRDFEPMSGGPGAVLPAQISEGVRFDADTSGPRALMLAVLEDAVRCIENGRWQRRFGARRLAAEAAAWVRCDRADWPFAFPSVCEALGIDVDAMRSRLLIRDPAPEPTPTSDRPCRRRPGGKGGDAQRANANLCRP
jgi:hypothetical protein